MRAPDAPENERDRLHSLYELELLDTDTSNMFDGAVEMASQITGCPIALVSLVDANRQWFAAARNLDATETNRDVSFCGHAILDTEVLVVPDARVDARFHDNPLVTDDPNIVFYAGAPLVMPDGTALGTVCVIDREPRYLSERQTRALAQLSRFVVDQLELRRTLIRLERQTNQQLAEHQRQSERLSALGRDLESAMGGLEARVQQVIDPSEGEAELEAMRQAIHGIANLGRSIGESGLLGEHATETSISRVDPAEVMSSVLETFSAEIADRSIATDVRMPTERIELLTDRERLRFLCFHWIAFLLSPPGDTANLTITVRSDPQSGAELAGYVLRDTPYQAPPTEQADIDLLQGLARGLKAELTTLLDEEQQLLVKLRLPLQI